MYKAKRTASGPSEDVEPIVEKLGAFKFSAPLIPH